MSDPRGHGCDPELIFELADREMESGQERELREHVRSCPECRDLYRRELNLTSCLRSLDLSEPENLSVSRGVAMALPTRPVKMRLLWAMLAGAMLVAALVALQLNGMDPVSPAISASEMLLSMVSGFADVARTIFAVAGSALIIAFVIGAMLDLLIAAVLLSASRRARRV